MEPLPYFAAQKRDMVGLSFEKNLGDDTMHELEKAGTAGALGVIAARLGWFGWLAVVWAALMLSDWLVGSAVAAKAGKWSSSKLREGAWHKGGMVVMVCVALVTDWLIGTLLRELPGVSLPFTYSVLLGPLVMVWYIIGELGSLAEHAVSLGAKAPRWMLQILEVSRDAVDAAGEALAHEGKSEDIE